MKRIVTLIFSFSILGVGAIAVAGFLKGEGIRLRPTTLPASAPDGEIRLDTSDSKVKKYDEATTSWVGLGGTTVSKCSVRYTTNAGMATVSGVAKIIDFEDIDFETGSCVSSVTTGASWRFTAPVNGVYNIEVFVTQNYTASSIVSAVTKVYIDINGGNTIVLGGRNHDATNNAFSLAGGGTLVNLTAGDYIEPYIVQNTGAAQTLSTAGADNHISITRIEPFQANEEPCALKYDRNAIQTISSTTETTVLYNNQQYEEGQCVGTYSAGVFTAPVNGVYSVCASVRLFEVETWTNGLDVYLQTVINSSNDTKLFEQRNKTTQAGDRFRLIHGCTDVKLNATDTLEIEVYHNETGTRDISSSGSTLSIHKVN